MGGLGTSRQMSTVHESLEPVRPSPGLQVARLTLSRPPLNILDIPMIHQLCAALERAVQAPDVAAIVIAADGPSFSAGVEVRDHVPERAAEMLHAFHSVFRVLARTDKLTLAEVQGPCLGGGCELATFCDIVIASGNADFALPEIRLGCFPPVAAITFPRLIGEKRAIELLLTGRRMSAREAEAMALITAVDTEGNLRAASERLLSLFFANSVVALRLAKRAIRLDFAEEFERRLDDVERLYLDELAGTADAQEGIRAFLEKRAARWTNQK